MNIQNSIKPFEGLREILSKKEIDKTLYILEPMPESHQVKMAEEMKQRINEMALMKGGKIGRS